MGRFARYELTLRIALGGMAEVWAAKAFAADGSAHDVVVKRMLPQFGEASDVQSMLLEEAEVTSHLKHPNIVETLDIGQLDGTLFLAMERVEGLDARQLLDASAMRGKPALPAEVALFIVAEVLKGLDHAHRAKDRRGQPLAIVHRDVSPSNVLLSLDGAVKLADFGIARAKTRASHTQVGTVRGKPRYMSPEQARGEELDGRSDVFAAGLVLHELLTGEPVFPASGYLDEVLAVMARGIPAPSRVRPDVAAHLDGIVMALCEREVSRRFRSAADAASAVEECARLYGVELSARPLAELVRSIVRPTAAAKPSSTEAKSSTRIVRVDDLDGVARFATQAPAQPLAGRASPSGSRTVTAPGPASPSGSRLPPRRASEPFVNEDPTSARIVPLDDDRTSARFVPDGADRTSARRVVEEDPTSAREIAAAEEAEEEEETSARDIPAAEEDATDARDIPGRAAPRRPAAGHPGGVSRAAPAAPRAGPSRALLAGGAAVLAIGLAGAVWQMQQREAELSRIRRPSRPASSSKVAPSIDAFGNALAGAPTPEPAEDEPTPEPAAPEEPAPVRTPRPKRTPVATVVDFAAAETPPRQTPPPAASSTPAATPAVAEATKTPAPTGTGFLTLRARPNGEVTIDGQWAGFTPLTKHPLPAGKHAVVVHSETGKKASTEIEIVPDETLSRSLVLK